MRYWLSFADASRPHGEQLLGVCIVHAVGMVNAVRAAHALGINPGGEVRGIPIDESAAARLSFDLAEHENRLIPPDEAKALNDRITTELAS